MKMKIFAIAILVVGMATLAWAFYPQATTRIEYETKVDGVLDNTVVKLLRPNGDWKSVTTYYQNGQAERVDTVYGIGGVGVLAVKENELVFLGPKAEGRKPPMDETKIKASSAFGGESYIAGERVLKIVNAQGSFSLAPDLDGVALRTEVVGFTREAVRITYLYVDDFGALPDLPISYAGYEKQAQVIEQQ